MAEKGIWMKATERAGGKIGDAKLELSGFWELIDGPGLTNGFGLLDNLLIDRLIKDEQSKVDLRIMFYELVNERDIVDAQAKAVEIQQRIANIPGLDDEFEKQIVGQLAGGLMNLFLKFINDNQE